MDYSNFIILLARQRSGTNALRSILESHPDIFCLNEVFNFNTKDSEIPLLRETNYFNFMIRYADGDVRKLYPDHHELLFLGFLDYLRCFTSKCYVLLDVKYNSMHFLTKPWQNMMSPFLFELIECHGLKIVNLRRKNYLRYLLSVRKAWKSRRYFVKMGDTSYSDHPIHIDSRLALQQCETCYLEDSIIQNRFASYPHYFPCEYAEIFRDDSGKASEAFLQQISSRLGIANTFTNQSKAQKQASLPLRETIENYDEIVSALKGTEFEYCLEDEAMYC